MTALKKHSQNNMLFDPNKALEIKSNQLEEFDFALSLFDFPFNTKSSYEEFESYVTLWGK